MFLSYSSALALLCIILACVFSVPVPSLPAVVTSQGIFQKALSLGDITDPQAFAAKVANSLSSDPRICAPVADLFQQLLDGESDASGVNTIGDRAIVGARKLLDQQNNGDNGLTTTLTDLAAGTYQANILKALQDAFSNPPLTIASLQTYKLLIDTESAIVDLANLVERVGGNSSIAISSSQIQNALVQVEATIDSIGADFTVQNVANQSNDLQQILSLLGSSQTNSTQLPGLNGGLLSSITAATKLVEDTMNKLISSAQQANQLSTSEPVIPLEVFQKPGPGTACSATGAVSSSDAASATTTSELSAATGAQQLDANTSQNEAATTSPVIVATASPTNSAQATKSAKSKKKSSKKTKSKANRH